MARTKGIGGVFIDSRDAAALMEWYRDKLGIKFDEHEGGYFHVFQTRDFDEGFVRYNPVFAINPAKEPLAETGRGFTLNLRVDNLEEMLAELRQKNVESEGEMIVWAGGKHIWIRDLDGNRIELYEELFFTEGE